MSTVANPTILLNSITPAAPANGLNVKPQATGTDPVSVSFYVPGDGNTSHFLRGDGTWQTPSSGAGFSFLTATSGSIVTSGVVWVDNNGGTWTIPNGTTNGQRLTIIFNTTVYANGPWTFNPTTLDSDGATSGASIVFTSTSISSAGQGFIEMIWEPNGWFILESSGASVTP